MSLVSSLYTSPQHKQWPNGPDGSPCSCERASLYGMTLWPSGEGSCWLCVPRGARGPASTQGHPRLCLPAGAPSAATWAWPPRVDIPHVDGDLCWASFLLHKRGLERQAETQAGGTRGFPGTGAVKGYQRAVACATGRAHPGAEHGMCTHSLGRSHGFPEAQFPCLESAWVWMPVTTSV